METRSKRILYLVLFWVGMFSGITAVRAQGTVSMDVFYSELAPYGTWITDAQYGYIWVPDAGPGFQPYATNGYWVMTEYGNTWVSDYSWGWAPFHYGRWLFDDYYGWVWIPGTEWAPAWVAWRSGGDYYGWAPLGPGVAISVSVGNYIPDPYWVFVPQRYVCGPGAYHHYVYYRNDVTIIHRTVIVNTTHNHRHRDYFTGPSRQDIERSRGSRIDVHTVNAVGRPGATVVRDRRIEVYRPVVRRDRNERAPAGVTSPEEFRRAHPARKDMPIRSTVAGERIRKQEDAQIIRQREQRTGQQRDERRQALERVNPQGLEEQSTNPVRDGQRRETEQRNIRTEQQNDVQRRREIEQVTRPQQEQHVEQQQSERRREAGQLNQQRQQEEQQRQEAQQLNRQRQLQEQQNDQERETRRREIEQLNQQREQQEGLREQRERQANERVYELRKQQEQLDRQRQQQEQNQREQQNQQRQQQVQQQRQQQEQQRPQQQQQPTRERPTRPRN